MRAGSIPELHALDSPAGGQIHFFAIGRRPFAVNDKKIALPIQRDQRVVPGAGLTTQEEFDGSFNAGRTFLHDVTLVTCRDDS